jgi:hypothetical protein
MDWRNESRINFEKNSRQLRPKERSVPGFSDHRNLVAVTRWFFHRVEVLVRLLNVVVVDRLFRWRWRRGRLGAGSQIKDRQDNKYKFSHGGVGFVFLGAIGGGCCDGGVDEGGLPPSISKVGSTPIDSTVVAPRSIPRLPTNTA